MRGGVARNVPVVDVSEANDWSAVRVGLGRSGDFGAVYPTYGFIYDRPDDGVILATAHAPAPQPALNPAPRDLRPVAERPWPTFEQVAQAPPQVPVAPSAPANAEQRPALPTTGGAVGTIDRSRVQRSGHLGRTRGRLLAADAGRASHMARRARYSADSSFLSCALHFSAIAIVKHRV